MIKHRSSYSDINVLDYNKNKSMNSTYKRIINDKFEKLVDEVIKEEGKFTERGRQSVTKK